MVPSLLRSSRILLQNDCAFHAVLGAVKAFGKADTCPWCHLRCDPRESFRKAIAPPMGSSGAFNAFYKADGYMVMVPSPLRSLRVFPQSDCVPKGSSGPSHVGDMRSSRSPTTPQGSYTLLLRPQGAQGPPQLPKLPRSP